MGTNLSARDLELLAAAVALSRNCPPSDTAFAVGAVIATPSGEVVARGHSRMTGPRTHAEEEAIAATGDRDLRGTTIFVSMEPCGERASSPTPCARRIVEAGIARMVYLVGEPEHFVTPKGVGYLREAGVEVVHAEASAPDLAAEVRALNPHGFRG